MRVNGREYRQTGRLGVWLEVQPKQRRDDEHWLALVLGVGAFIGMAAWIAIGWLS